MTRPRNRGSRNVQVTIDDLDLGWEHIPGAMPAGDAELAIARAMSYAALVAASDAQCVPDQKIHVYADSNPVCVCGKKKERA